MNTYGCLALLIGPAAIFALFVAILGKLIVFHNPVYEEPENEEQGDGSWTEPDILVSSAPETGWPMGDRRS
jgi:hypothetical protein